MNTIRILITSSALLLLYSCNTSLSVLNRKYRPGYTIEFSKNNVQESTAQLPIPISKATSTQDDEPLTACIDQSDQPVVQTEQPQKIPVMVESGQKKIKYPRVTEKKPFKPFFAHAKKQSKPVEETSVKPMEPFNLVACFLVGAGILLAVILHANVLLAILIFLSTLALVCLFSWISDRRMNKYPERYSRVSKILNKIFITIGIIFIVVFLAFLKTIWTRE